MPKRWISVAIVLFWLTMTGWLIGREWWQRYGSPPTMLSALDAATSEGPVEVYWRIVGNDRDVGRATTVIKAMQGKYYTMEQRVHLDLEKVGHLPLFHFLGPILPSLPVQELDMVAETELNFFGELHKFALRVTLPSPKQIMPEPRDGEETPKLNPPLAQFTFDGRPQNDGTLHANLRVMVAGAAIQLPAPLDKPYVIPYRGKDLAFGSLCPLDRMPDLRSGQKWQSPVTDPSSLIMFGMPGDNNVLTRLLDRQPAQTQVLPSAEALEWQGQSVPCWVIVTDQDNLHLRIWARVDNGLILKQSADWGQTRIDIIRESIFKMK